jgi:signal transduction histidine kinase
VAAQRQPFLLDSQDQSSPFAAQLTRPHITSSLCLPLHAKTRPLGVLNLNKHNAQAPFTRVDADLLSILTMQAGLALERLRLAEQRLRDEKLAAIGGVVSNLVHDMRSPLTVIHGAAEMLEEMSEANQTFTRMIIRETDRLAEMAQDVLDFARGEENLCPEPCLVRDLVEEVVHTLQRQFERDPVEITAQIDYPGEMQLDARKMRRVLLNLGTNAREALPEGGRIHFRAWAEPETVAFSVSDTGCGIPPDLQERIFEPFFTRGKKNGTGLGLPIVKSIVAGHGGTVELQSQPGEGTTFTLRLPHRTQKGTG